MHAALVTAYKDFAMLERLVLDLKARGMKVLVHIDGRSRDKDRALEMVRSSGALAYSWYPVYWGSLSHLAAILALMRVALQDRDVSYLHILSGQDYPIQDEATFDRVCDGRIFLDCQPLETTGPEVRIRFEYYRVRDIAFPLLRLPATLDRLVLSAQQRTGVRRVRTRRFDRIHKGLVWCSLPSDAGRHAVLSSDSRRLWRALRCTALPEEFFFQTLFVNSIFEGRICRENKRYMEWSPRAGVRPAVLDERDFRALRESDCLFARKFESSTSNLLLELLSGKVDS